MIPERLRIGLAWSGVSVGRRGGVEVYARQLLRNLAARCNPQEAEIVVLVPATDAEGVGSLPDNVSLVHLGGSGAPRFEAARYRLRQLALVGGWVPAALDPRSEEIDALGLGIVHYPCSRLTELRLETPTVVSLFDLQEDVLPGFFPRRERWSRRVHNRWAMRRASTVLVPSLYSTRSVADRHPADASKLVTLAPGVSDEFTPVAKEGEATRLRARYGIGDGDFLFYPANPWPHKNHPRLFAALRRLAAGGGPSPTVVCTGRLESEKRSAGSLAREAGIADRVHDLGFVPEHDVPALYRAARLLVFPSLFEGFGLPVTEAMASGCPVACSGTTALAEIASGAARTFDPTSEAEIADAIREAWTDQDLRAQLRQQGLLRVVEYRWDRIVPRLLEQYRRAARVPRPERNGPGTGLPVHRGVEAGAQRHAPKLPRAECGTIEALAANHAVAPSPA